MSELYFTFHAVARCIERGISEGQIVETVSTGAAQKSDDGKKVYSRGRMRVVVLYGSLVITAFRKSRRNPKRNIRKARQARRKEIQAFGVKK